MRNKYIYLKVEHMHDIYLFFPSFFFLLIVNKKVVPSFLSLSRKVLFDNSGKSNLVLYDSLSVLLVFIFFLQGKIREFFLFFNYKDVEKREKKIHICIFALRISSLLR